MPGISTPARRWCPLCLQEGAREGFPYGQLLWEIGIVTACPKHHIKLLDACGCDPAQAHSPLKAKFLPHLCAACGNSLAMRPGIQVEAAAEAEIRTASLVGDLLGSPLFDPGWTPPGDANIVDFLHEAVRNAGDGNAARTARIIGVGKGSLNGWLHRHHLPSLAQAASMAEVFGIPMAEILTGGGAEKLWSLTPKEKEVGMPFRGRRKRPRPVPAEELERRLGELLDAGIPVSGEEAARLLGTTTRRLYQSFPDLIRAITTRSQEHRRQDTLERREEGLSLIREIATQLALAGSIPTRRRLEESIQGRSTFFLSKERVACRRICQEVRKEHLP